MTRLPWNPFVFHPEFLESLFDLSNNTAKPLPGLLEGRVLTPTEATSILLTVSWMRYLLLSSYWKARCWWVLRGDAWLPGWDHHEFVLLVFLFHPERVLVWVYAHVVFQYLVMSTFSMSNHRSAESGSRLILWGWVISCLASDVSISLFLDLLQYELSLLLRETMINLQHNLDRRILQCLHCNVIVHFGCIVQILFSVLPLEGGRVLILLESSD